MRKKELILVRVPCEHVISAAVTAFLCTLERMNSEPNCPYRFETGLLGNYKPVDYSRNVIVKNFLAVPEASRLWFIDSDIVPAPNTMQLILHKGDIVAAPYPFWGQRDKSMNPDVTWGIYDWKGKGYIQPGILEKGLKEHDAAPTGMMIIRRHVFENPKMVYPVTSHTMICGDVVEMGPDDPKPFFRNVYKFTGALEATEDIEFCYRAKTIGGYDVWMDHGIKCGHLKMVNLAQVMDFAVAAYKKGADDMCEYAMRQEDAA